MALLLRDVEVRVLCLALLAAMMACRESERRRISFYGSPEPPIASGPHRVGRVESDRPLSTPLIRPRYSLSSCHMKARYAPLQLPRWTVSVAHAAIPPRSPIQPAGPNRY